ncbi:MAG: ion transporter [Chloroflexi bacterium]|nr:ion transporter [Chloroflexota bacterium]
MSQRVQDNQEEVARQRGELLARVSDWLDAPLSLLAFVMLGLLILELTVELSPAWAARVVQAQLAIWVIFAAAFLLEFALAPAKVQYLKTHWLTAISVALPALRAVRVFRAARALRGLRLIRLVTTFNRGTGAIEQIFRRGQFGYVAALTLIVTITAAAGASYFERGAPQASITTLGDAVWWAAAMVTTINAQLETTTFEGRVIGLLLRVYGMTVAGYVTAAIAAYLIGQPEPPERAEAEHSELHQLRLQVARLEEAIRRTLPERPHEEP